MKSHHQRNWRCPTQPTELAELFTQLLTATELSLTNLIKSSDYSVGEPFDPDVNFKRKPVQAVTKQEEEKPEVPEQEELYIHMQNQ